MDLGPLEMEVLGLLDREHPRSVSELRARLGKKLAYTTVMTVLNRLHQKGVVVRSKDGNRYLYAPAARAGSVADGIFSRMRRALFHSDKARPILALLEDEDLSDEDLRALKSAINRRMREKKT
jgi:predicted transcriptional regulator